VIRAQKFQLVDAQGKVRAEMLMSGAHGGPVIRAQEFQVVDDKGEIRAALRLDDGKGPNVTLWNPNRTTAAQLSLDDQAARTALVLSGQSGKHQVTIRTNEESGPGINLATARGEQARLMLGVGDGGHPYVTMNGKPVEPAR